MDDFFKRRVRSVACILVIVIMMPFLISFKSVGEVSDIDGIPTAHPYIPMPCYELILYPQKYYHDGQIYQVDGALNHELSEYVDTAKKIYIYQIISELCDQGMSPSIDLANSILRAYFHPDEENKRAFHYLNDESGYTSSFYYPGTNLESFNYKYGCCGLFAFTVDDIKFILQMAITAKRGETEYYWLDYGFDWRTGEIGRIDPPLDAIYQKFEENDPEWLIREKLREIGWESSVDEEDIYGYYEKVYLKEPNYTPDWDKYTLTKTELAEYCDALINYIYDPDSKYAFAIEYYYHYNHGFLTHKELYYGRYSTYNDDGSYSAAMDYCNITEIARGSLLCAAGISYEYEAWYGFDGLTGERAAEDWFKINFCGQYDDIFVKHKYAPNCSTKNVPEGILYEAWEYRVYANGDIEIISDEDFDKAHGKGTSQLNKKTTVNVSGFHYTIIEDRSKYSAMYVHKGDSPYRLKTGYHRADLIADDPAPHNVARTKTTDTTKTPTKEPDSVPPIADEQPSATPTSTIVGGIPTSDLTPTLTQPTGESESKNTSETDLPVAPSDAPSAEDNGSETNDPATSDITSVPTEAVQAQNDGSKGFVIPLAIGIVLLTGGSIFALLWKKSGQR